MHTPFTMTTTSDLRQANGLTSGSSEINLRLALRCRCMQT